MLRPHDPVVPVCSIRAVVSFCSIRSEHPMTRLKCPAPRWGGTGGNALSGTGGVWHALIWLDLQRLVCPKVLAVPSRDGLESHSGCGVRGTEGEVGATAVPDPPAPWAQWCSTTTCVRTEVSTGTEVRWNPTGGTHLSVYNESGYCGRALQAGFRKRRLQARIQEFARKPSRVLR